LRKLGSLVENQDATETGNNNVRDSSPCFWPISPAITGSFGSTPACRDRQKTAKSGACFRSLIVGNLLSFRRTQQSQ
jgi:hypothetical protein